MWQIFPILMLALIAFAFFKMRGQLGASTESFYRSGLEQFRSTVAGIDSKPAKIVIASERSTLSNKVYGVALTDDQLIMAEFGKPPATFARSDVELSMSEKTFHDQGNMQTTISTGYEMCLKFPSRQTQKLRVYPKQEGYEGQGASVQALSAAVC